MSATLRRLSRRVTEQERMFAQPVPLPDGPQNIAYTAGGLCTIARESGARVVHLCGERPGGDAEGFAYWRGAGLEPWAPRPEGHYLRDLLTPVLRYQHPDGTKVDLRAVGEWFGDHSDATPLEAEEAFAVMREALERHGPAGSLLWASPQATGTDLLLRMLPERGEWPALEESLRLQIQRTSTQGRIQTWPAPAVMVDPHLPRLVEYDGRFMYAALCAELPEGPPVLGDGWPDPDALGYLPGTEPVMVRARLEVEWRPPAGWDQVGILPHLGSAGWTWPTSRRWWRGWVDGAEVLVALRWGWEVRVRRHVAWRRPAGGGPLRSWAAALVAAREWVGLLGDTRPTRFAAAGLRAILLTTVGVLHGKGHDVTRTAPVAEPLRAGPTREALRVEGEHYVWSEAAPPARPEFAHPEWSAAIWARCRARMLDARGPGNTRTGALHLDPSTIVGFSVDALYLTVDPEWADDGKVGRLRRRAIHEGPLPIPRNRGELLALLRGARGE